MASHQLQARRAALRARLAELGVPLFERSAVGPPLRSGEYARLVTELLRSGDVRLRLAIPCLLAANDASAAAAVGTSAAGLSRAERTDLGLLYRLARCLVISRAPLLAYRLGRRPRLPPLPVEPAGVPDPDELRGEKGLRFASEWYRERRLPDLPGGAERQFDTWLDLVRTGSRRSESA
jgi:hypothetical protein